MNDYRELIMQVESLIGDENDPIVAMANTSAAIFSEVSDLNWAGFYRLIDGCLVLGPFQGQVACTRIRVGRGVCGTAVLENRTLNVPNVHEFTGHIACDSASNSEIVVPIRKGDGSVIGVLDIDSVRYERFGEGEQECFEHIADLLGKQLYKA